MTEDDYRRIALTLPGAIEISHMNHPDFRVGGKIFATLWPGQARGVVMLKPDQQLSMIALAGEIFHPVPGGWGARGATNVRLSLAEETLVSQALLLAWRNKAPRSLYDA